ncbi:hypothetical protein GCM10009836_72620 [Pseudonocardia ailaonensis]|uniref:HTH gntR-type domain-containing protein n=2 Tax=Pseudonocardia ailaonensis TaxID=367279 RepID=A0ABN2NRQ4_9PSEU
MLDELDGLDPNSSRTAVPPDRSALLHRGAGSRARNQAALRQPLAIRFGVARMTVQSAISQLARDGLVTGPQGSGVLVSDRTSLGAFDVAEILRRAARAGLLTDPDRLPDAD